MASRFLFWLLKAARPPGDRVPDSVLLERFAASRDSAAFELLLHRHANAVWAACRRILVNDADAEDAFQATFVVLMRKADSIRKPCVGGWLHRVAVNAALKLKASRRRASAVLESLAERPQSESDSPEQHMERAELASLLQQELARLPERYRLPVVLCDLEGHTHAEAAVVLSWPVGSVSGRLSRAHALLRDRLTRRGVAAPAILFATLAYPLPANAIPAATALVAGSISPSVSILVQGVLTAMTTAKLKLTAWVVASVGLVAMAGVGTVSAWPRSGVPVAALVKLELPLEVAAPVPPEAPIEGDWIPKNPKDPAPTAFPNLKLPAKPHPKGIVGLCPNLFAEGAFAIEPADDTYRRLLKAQLHQGIQYIQLFNIRIEIGTYQSSEFDDFVRTQDSLRATAIELWANDLKMLIPKLEEFVLLAKQAERFMKARAAAGSEPPQQWHSAQRHRLEAEAVLWKALHPKPAGK